MGLECDRHRPSRQEVKRLLEEEGLVFLGIVGLSEEESFQKFKSWIDEKKHADMKYLENYMEMRHDPSKIFSGACTAIVYGFSYFQGSTFKKPGIAQYARIRDYHKLLKKKARKLINYLESFSSADISLRPIAKAFVDTAPILERALALKTGEGFIGKNTCFIHRELGSFIVLGEVFTNLVFAEDDYSVKAKESLSCNRCNRCIDNCPTSALSPYKLDASRCLSYLTIESALSIPREYWSNFKNFFFGCDICQAVCPHNHSVAEVPGEVEKYKSGVESIDLFDIATMSQEKYEKYFGGTSCTRAKIFGLRRNALIAMAVTGDARLGKALDAIKTSDHSLLHQVKDEINEFLKSNSRD